MECSSILELQPAISDLDQPLELISSASFPGWRVCAAVRRHAIFCHRVEALVRGEQVQTFCNPHHMRTSEGSLLHIEPIANAVAELRAEGVSMDRDLATELDIVYPKHVNEEWRECNVKPKLDELNSLASAIDGLLSGLYEKC